MGERVVNEKRFNQVFSRNLQAIMLKRDIRQSELARLMDVSSATMSDWYNGNKTPRPAHIDQLCDILNCTHAALMLEPVIKPEDVRSENVPFERDDYRVILKFLKLGDESKRFVESVIDRDIEQQTK